MFASLPASTIIYSPGRHKADQEAMPLSSSGTCIAKSASPIDNGYLRGRLDGVGSSVEVAKGQEIVGQGDRADSCFEVIHGCVRTLQRLEDGRSQVSEFLLPGDIFGLDASGEHEFAAEAVTAATIRRVRLCTIDLLTREDAAFEQDLRHHLCYQIKAARRRLVALGRMTAAEKIAGFLLEMSGRLDASEQGAVKLPMCRGDIADYLGLTIETVSRCMTDLKRRNVISLHGSLIAILDRRLLATKETLH
ncbi:helix-turn-helix domain-containing protein [Acidisoma silvae]|uniref:Helix-turn-helix domain-containing protein n=1 Tax=Acidisoma silvae TaxID=2802396 RepID=A0A964E0C7_9PROT|nr:helix-turn-helix domain-containing protein [Acidisoma silvae]MCB8877380.1 helix-turn-helix domain-containing protein [Acidisoma silvae]